jgi:hypothetical protein
MAVVKAPSTRRDRKEWEQYRDPSISIAQAMTSTQACVERIVAVPATTCLSSGIDLVSSRLARQLAKKREQMHGS